MTGISCQTIFEILEWSFADLGSDEITDYKVRQENTNVTFEEFDFS